MAPNISYDRSMDKDKIWQSQLAALKEIEVNLFSLAKATEETQSRIRNHGLEHNHSQNHDCYHYAMLVWKGSLRLAELKKLEMELKGYDSYGRKIKQEGD